MYLGRTMSSSKSQQARGGSIKPRLKLLGTWCLLWNVFKVCIIVMLGCLDNIIHCIMLMSRLCILQLLWIRRIHMVDRGRLLRWVVHHFLFMTLISVYRVLWTRDIDDDHANHLLRDNENIFTTGLYGLLYAVHCVGDAIFVRQSRGLWSAIFISWQRPQGGSANATFAWYSSDRGSWRNKELSEKNKERIE